jgi:Fis family transcriptional regulator, factor for inversion stimulation protein
MSIVETVDNILEDKIEETNLKSQSLKETVHHSLQEYFSKLGGTFIDNLYEMVLAEIEEPLLKAVMHYTKDNQSKAAILLGLSRGTLRKKLKMYGLLN